MLFQRYARGMKLTHAGHEFLRHCHRILDAVAAAERALSVRPEALAGDLVIGAIGLLTGYYLPGLLERYRRAFPNVRTWVYEDAGQFIEHQLINGELDAGLTIVVAVPLVDAPPPLEIGVAWRRGAPVGAATEAFLAVAREHGRESDARR